MIAAHSLDRGREAFARMGWAESYAQLSAVDRESPLAPDDLERLSIAAYLLGRDADSEEVLARAHNEYVSRGRFEEAARAAFWLGFQLFGKGEMARGSGWLARARRLVDEVPDPCVVQGFLLVPAALQLMQRGDVMAAYETFSQAAATGERFHDVNLTTLGRLGQGQALIALGEIAPGVALLDEVMVDVTNAEVSPVIVGVVYCATLDACSGIFDVRRAQEWTTALSQWCASQPDLVPFRGECLVRRAEIMQLHGAWLEAMGEIERARDALAQRGKRAASAAVYELGELHRLRGEFAKAEEAYRLAVQWGHKSQPGLARLRMDQGQVAAAAAAIRLVAEEARDRRARSRMLGAYVDIMLAVHDVPAAHAAADELSKIAGELDSPFLRAASAHATGAVLLAKGDARSALLALRAAAAAWREFPVPYEGARSGVLVGLACRALGDEDAAELELDAARQTFETLGAVPDLVRLREVRKQRSLDSADRLTPRELEVLRLVAAGKTNRAIADELGISEKTVARHVSNIFMKLDLPTRAAATAYAYKHDLV
jgi:DNA-binding CsgD family transcriptional regulator